MGMGDAKPHHVRGHVISEARMGDNKTHIFLGLLDTGGDEVVGGECLVL